MQTLIRFLLMHILKGFYLVPCARHDQWCRYLDHDAAGNGQISVKPGVPYPTAVTLDADLETALLRPLRPRLYLKYSDSLVSTSEKHMPFYIMQHHS